MELYDVLGVSLTDEDRPRGTVRVMGTRLSKEDADSYMRMAVVRRGVEREFFAVVSAGKYKGGEKYDG